MGRWILISFVSFPLTIIIIVGILLVVKPPAKAPAATQAVGAGQQVEKKLIKKVVAHDIRIGNMKHVRYMVDSLLTVIDVFRDSLQKQAVKMDSLNKTISALQKEKEALNSQILTWQKKYNLVSGQQMEAKSIAKTLATLKPKEMAKILDKMDDHTIILIYKQMSNSARSSLMAALSSNRAAAITQKMLKRKAVSK